MTAPESTTGDPYRDEMVRRVTQRVPLGFVIFVACVALSTFFEVVHFPERRAWIGLFAATFLALATGACATVRRRPAWTIPVLVVFVNVVGAEVNLYHAIVGA